MNKIKSNILPVIIGCVISIFLIVSFFLPRIWAGNITVESFNTVLVVITLCLSVHLVRKTSAIFYKNVWNSPFFTMLLLIPVLNLIIIACQFIWGELTFFSHPFFSGVLVLVSLPAFCCYYFSVLFFLTKKKKNLLLSNILLDLAGGIYIIFRLVDRSLFPIAEIYGVEIAAFIEKLFSASSYASLVVYVLAFINFIICGKILAGAEQNKYKNN